ncbi:MAG: pilus assembly protein [Desulfobacteraceae bacterium]|nr:pilus assembly protein [Desulfobacteraceae bacterium]
MKAIVKKIKTNNTEQGGAAVEFALVLPLLVVLVFGIVEFSILFYNKAIITNAGREGARAGIVYDFPDRPNDAAITNVVTAYCNSQLITFGDITQTPSVTVARSGAGTGSDLSVTVGYDYDFLVMPNFLRVFFSNTDISDRIRIEATAVMRLE